MISKKIQEILYVSSLAAILLCTHSLARAETRVFAAALDKSKWMHSSNKLSCKLEHEIPEYGKLIFSQMAGEPEDLKLKVYYGRALVKELGEVKFLPPKWKVREQERPGISFRFRGQNQDVRFSSRQARQVLDALDKGFQPTFTHRDKTDLRQEIEAHASIVNFNEHYKSYLSCQSNLIPYSFDEIRNSSVYFTTGSVRLDEEAKTWLGYVLEYAKDPALRRIELAGFTDSVGSFRANHKLASSRVEEVQKYLLAAGVDEKQIKLRVFGEQRPQADNRSSHGRKMNRRVSIRVLR